MISVQLHVHNPRDSLTPFQSFVLAVAVIAITGTLEKAAHTIPNLL